MRTPTISPEEPFQTVLTPRWLPAAMTTPPQLNPAVPHMPVEPRYALLLNPFYPKDPHASFGKHVLTPTLALTSLAGATPPEWRLRYWDENLLQGPPRMSQCPRWSASACTSHSRAMPMNSPRGIAPAARSSSSAACTCCPVRKRRRRTPMLSRSATACSSGQASCAMWTQAL